MASKNLSFIEHLEELRWGIIYALLSIFVLSIISYFFSGDIIDFLTKPVDRLIFIKPLEAFMTRIKISIATGGAVAMPFVLFLLWHFVSPALHTKEKKPLILGVFFSTLFFLGGISFAHFVVVPIGMLSAQSLPMERNGTQLGVCLKRVCNYKGLRVILKCREAL